MLRHTVVFVTLAATAGVAGRFALAGAAAELAKLVALVFALVSVLVLLVHVYETIATPGGRPRAPGKHPGP